MIFYHTKIHNLHSAGKEFPFQEDKCEYVRDVCDISYRHRLVDDAA